MFSNFYKFYNLDNSECKPIKNENLLNKFQQDTLGFKELMCAYEGTVFGRGEYRLHNLNQIPMWNEFVCIAFPKLKGKVECFASNWLGYQFAMYNSITGKDCILIIIPESGEICMIQSNFMDFHNDVLVNNYDDCMNMKLYKKWLSKNNEKLSIDKCVGFKVPLFLGGKDRIDNLEIIDMEVYWSLTAQLIVKI